MTRAQKLVSAHRKLKALMRARKTAGHGYKAKAQARLEDQMTATLRAENAVVRR